MLSTEPALFVWGLFVVTAIGALLPIRVSTREDHVVLTIAATVDASLLGPPSLVLVWGGVAVAAPLIAGWAAVARGRGWPGGRAPAEAWRSIVWVGTSAFAITAGFIVGNFVYVTLFGRSYPVPLVTTGDFAVAAVAVTAAWVATMSVRVLYLRRVGGSLLQKGLDPFDSVLIPYLLPLMGGFPLIVASVALYRPESPWPSLFILWWCFPLYAATALDMHRRRLAQELRRDVFAKQRLAAIGEVSARIVHQSRHQVGLMGWSIHRLRGLVGPDGTTDAGAVQHELDALSEAKDRLSEMLTAELLHEQPAGTAPDPAGAGEGGGASGRTGSTGTATASTEGAAPLAARAGPGGAGRAGVAAPPGGLADGYGTEPGPLGPDGAPDPPRADPALPTVADVVRRVADQLRGEAARGGLTLQTDVDAAADEPAPRQLHDVVFNLVDNAIDAASTRVVVQVRGDAAGHRIVVSDDGPGLSDAAAEHLFEPFFTTKGDGTGMGLAIADALVGDLGGELTVERNDGLTTFRVSVPRHPRR